MAFPASSIVSLSSALIQVQGVAQGIKAQAGNTLVSLQAGPVSAIFIFQMLDQLGGLISQANQLSSTPGLNAYATANLPGYAGTLTADITTVINAAQVCINWVVTNFPASWSRCTKQ
jgi:hypothetical protein